MITALKNEDGFIFAYLEWQVVDKNGAFKNFGEYVYVQDCWIHRHRREKGLLAQMARITARHPHVAKSKYVYWNRKKYGDRLSKAFLIGHFLKG